MKVGTQIIAPEGWSSLPKDVVFNFLKSDGRSNRVFLVRFLGGKDIKLAAKLIILNRRKFEDACKSKMIVPAIQQHTLPPWLDVFESVDLTQIDLNRSSKHFQISHHQRVHRRLEFIQTAVSNIEKILTNEHPLRVINSYARECSPPQNEARYRLWVLTYLCFGRNVWTLLPPFHYSGGWKREQYPDTKFGAPSLAYGKNYGNGMSVELARKCVESYRKRTAVGVTMKRIYQEAMAHDFNCQISTTAKGLKIYTFSDGKPFPTENQFRYQIIKAIGRENIQRSLYGRVRHRTRLAASKGRFSEEISNLMERVEADGYYTRERPRGYLDKSTLPSICVVVGRDLLSGMKVGIGFSFGSERSTAYRMMLFSMAIPKVFFCRLFGVTLKDGEWPGEGLCGHFAVDRGPGASRQLIEDLENKFPILDIAPSWSGQSKATVESSHPRDVKIEGEPSFQQSALTPVELARREIMELIRFNNVANMEDRIDPESELIDVIPSPVGLWNYYDSIFRNDAQPSSIEDAVRKFLTKREFTLRENGIYLGARCYYSEELAEQGLFDRSGQFHSIETTLSGFILDLCIRYVWVEIKGRLYLLEAILRIRGDDTTLWMSLSELNEWEEARSRVLSEYRVHQNACSSELQQRFSDDSAKLWYSSTRKSGRPKKTSISKQETKEVLQISLRRKVS